MTFQQALEGCVRDLVRNRLSPDWQCVLLESGKEAALFANWGDDQPIVYCFNLPATIDGDAFDPNLYTSQCPIVAA